MSNHEVKYTEVTRATPPEHRALCECGHLSKGKNKQEVEDDRMKHLEYIERIKAHLSTRTPSLKQQRDHFQDMADHDPVLKHRPQWQIWADELSVRLGDKAPAWEQPELMDF